MKVEIYIFESIDFHINEFHKKYKRLKIVQQQKKANGREFLSINKIIISQNISCITNKQYMWA